MSNVKRIRLPTGSDVSGLEPTDYISAEALQSGDPQGRGKSIYADQTGRLDAGVRACNPKRKGSKSRNAILPWVPTGCRGEGAGTCAQPYRANPS